MAIDVSNYTSALSLDVLKQWQADGVGLVIIQAFPPGYSQYVEQRQQMRLCDQAGLAFDCYIYDYLADPTWRDGCLDGLTRAADEEMLAPRQLWLDEEDEETTRGWTPRQFVEAIGESVSVVNLWVGAGRPSQGIYTRRGWWDLTGNYTGFAWTELWDADYDGLPDTEQSWQPYGGWTERRVKQYRGTSVFDGVGGVDLNVLSINEAAELEPQEEEPVSCDTYKAAIDHAVQRLWLELKKKSLTKTPIKQITDELFAALQS